MIEPELFGSANVATSSRHGPSKASSTCGKGGRAEGSWAVHATMSRWRLGGTKRIGIESGAWARVWAWVWEWVWAGCAAWGNRKRYRDDVHEKV